jgi:AAA15 family ATPase/GTPase
VLKSVELRNYGPLSELAWKNLGSINLVIGGNSSGKTFLLKALYTAVRSLEEYRRGDEPRTIEEILASKLYWTFQAEKLGELVSKAQRGTLSCEIEFNDSDRLRYEIERDWTKKLRVFETGLSAREQNSIFLPAKEVISFHKIILKTRLQDKLFGFDDTYLDLALALQIPTQKGKNFPEFAISRKSLENIIRGKVVYNDTTEKWEYKQGNVGFPIGVTAEGVKKIAILDTLLGNRYLTRGSIIFIDEPESALHPAAISKFLDIIQALAEGGIQFVMASHSYFVIKKLYLIAVEKDLPIPMIAADGSEWRTYDLRNGLPQNAIIDESIRLYREETELALS